MTTPDTTEIIHAWQQYFSSLTDWQFLLDGALAKYTGCGPVYELDNPIDRPDESFAIVDMRHVPFTDAHYHTGGETEIYIVLTGSGTVYVRGEATKVEAGDAVVIEPQTAHFTLPASELVLAAINTPPFKSENYQVLSQSNPDVGFDQDQYAQLIAGRA